MNLSQFFTQQNIFYFFRCVLIFIGVVNIVLGVGVLVAIFFYKGEDDKLL